MSMGSWAMTSSMKPAPNPHTKYAASICRRRFWGAQGGEKRNKMKPSQFPGLHWEPAQQQVHRLLALHAASFARADFLIALPTTGLILY